jgi:hypothetical protein
MTALAATITADRHSARTGFTFGTLAAGLLGLFAIDNLLLLHFWGLSLPLTVALMFVAGTAITMLCAKFSASLPRVPYRTFAIAFAIALALFALGGEGHFFYANTDWEVRDAVLRDLATNPWPFAYSLHGMPYFLRAPLGTYLLPAMFGAHADIALLVSNSLRLALLLTLAWHLFERRRERSVVLAVFILFSGWDVVGTAINSALGERLSWDHLEQWNHGYQYSSNVTLAFWVPQHAIAGWACAVAFMLWRRGLAPVGLFAASIPLVAIWSPLAIMGAIPFAVFAGLDVLRRRVFTLNDVALAAIAVGVSLPALLYLQIGASDVGMHFRPTGLVVSLSCALLEVLPFVLPLLGRRASAVTDRPVIRIVLVLLLLMPLGQVGVGGDFQMRASIMPLALLSIAFAEWISWLAKEEPVETAAIAYSLVAIALGAATPLLELRRAVMNGPSPRPLCSLVGVWDKQDTMAAPYSTYLAPVSMLPEVLPHAPVIAGRSDPDTCWDRKWVTPRSPRRLAN